MLVSLRRFWFHTGNPNGLKTTIFLFVTLAPFNCRKKQPDIKCFQSRHFCSTTLQLLSQQCCSYTFYFIFLFDRFISPCRSLCESVRDTCAPIMSCYGYPWPEILRCDQYPADHLVCISSVTNTTVHTGVRSGENTQTHN